MEISADLVTKNLLMLMAEHDINQRQLALKANIAPEYLNRIIKMKSNIGIDTAKKLADALGVSVDSIIGNPTIKEKPTPTVGSLLNALSEQEKELAKIRANPLVVLAEKLSPELAKRAEKMLLEILKESAKVSDKSDSEDHRKKQ